MPRRVHATAEELTDWLSVDLDVDEDEVTRLLARASRKVDHWARAGYATDDEGVATDAIVRQALSDATCAQVEQWIEVGEENDVDGLAGTQISVTGYSGTRAPALAPRAYEALAEIGLTQPSQFPLAVAW